MSVYQLVLFILTSIFAFSSLAEEEKQNPYKLLPKDVFFQPGGGLRVRYENLRGATGEGFPDNEDEAQASHRAHFDIKLYKGETIETFFRFLNYADWGATAGDTNGGQRDGFARTNGLLVNQAYALWKVDDSIGVRFGRAPLHLGLGYTYGYNEWFNVPYSFDLIDAGWDWGGVELSLMALKVQEFSTITGQTASSDPEENHIIINLDIINPFDALEFLTINVVQINRDLGSPDGGTTVLNGLNQQRISLESKISGKNFFGSFFFTYIVGEEKVAPGNVQGGVEKLDLDQRAFDLKLGYAFPQYNNFRFWGGYHVDTGDKNNSDSNSESYDSFFYDVYGQAGLMDLIRWGNLSMYHFGLDLELFTDLTIGAEWWSFGRTENTDTVRFGEAGRFYNARVLAGDMTLGDGSDTGKEFDVWAQFKYQSGVNVRLTFANFFPGEVFTNATTNTGRTPDSDFFQFLAQVGYSF